MIRIALKNFRSYQYILGIKGFTGANNIKNEIEKYFRDLKR